MLKAIKATRLSESVTLKEIDVDYYRIKANTPIAHLQSWYDVTNFEFAHIEDNQERLERQLCKLTVRLLDNIEVDQVMRLIKEDANRSQLVRRAVNESIQLAQCQPDRVQMKLVVEVHDSVIQNAQYSKLPTEAKN